MVNTLEQWHDEVDAWLVANPGDYPGAVAEADRVTLPQRWSGALFEMLQEYYVGPV